MMRKIFVLALGLVWATAGCNEIDNTKPESSLAPAMITGATAVGYNGGITVAWTNPEDSRFGYVKIDYTDPTTGKAMVARAVYPATSWNLEGPVPEDGQVVFKLITVSEAGVHSTAPAVTVSAVATLPPVVTGLTATPGNGRITLTWTNPTDNNVKEVEMSYTDPRPGDNNGTTVVTKFEYSTSTAGANVESVVKRVVPAYGSLAFTVTVVGTNGLRGPETSISATALAPLVPENVAELAAEAGKGDIALSWKNPSDEEFNGTEVSFIDPREESATKGQVVTTKLAASATSYKVEGLFARYGEIEFTVKTVNVFDLKSTGVKVKAASQLAKVPQKLTLVADQMWVSNSSAGYDGGGVETLIDGNLSTYWHSAWSPRASLPYTLVVRLPKSITQMQFKATNRNHGNKYGMKTGEVWLGNDQSATMTKVADITATQTDPVPARGTFTSPVYQLASGSAFDTFRLEMLTAQLGDTSISFAEFEIYEIVDEEPVP